MVASPLASTPQERLHKAVKEGDWAGYHAALAEGADPHRAPSFDQDLVETVCKASRHTAEHLAIVEHLVQHVGLRPFPGHLGLLSVAKSGSVELLQRLAAWGYDPRTHHDRALDLATDLDLKEKRQSTVPYQNRHRPMIRALLNLGCDLDSGRGESRHRLTESFEQEAYIEAVSVLDRTALDSVWSNADSFGVRLSANALLQRLLMSSPSSFYARAQDRHPDDLFLDMVDALIERGGWIGPQGRPGEGPTAISSFMSLAMRLDLPDHAHATRHALYSFHATPV